MPLRFAYTRPDGGLSIVNAAPKAHLDRMFGESLTDEEYRALVIWRSIPEDATDVQELPDNWTPPDIDGTFRNAWRKSGSKFTVDMPLARDIWRQKMRRVRTPLLSALDIDYQMADEAADTKAKSDVAARKQTLRDVTADPGIEAAQTTDELRAVWPDCLK